jgi:hypothetical protein
MWSENLRAHDMMKKPAGRGTVPFRHLLIRGRAHIISHPGFDGFRSMIMNMAIGNKRPFAL